MLRFTETGAQRAVRALLTGLLILSCAAPGACLAGRPVRVYEVDLDGPSAGAVQDAMRVALVRATGRREAADDAALASVVANAVKYVKSYATGPQGESQVMFNGPAVEQAIAAAGRSVWSRDRPFTLVTLYPPRSRADEQAARAELERVATGRGLPVSLIPLTVVDPAGQPLPAATLLEYAQRYGGDELLVGRTDGAAADAPLQWTLYTPVSTQTWSGSLAGGIDHTVDALVPQQGGALAQTDAATSVHVDGVRRLGDYAEVQRLLQSVPGVRSANLAGADAASVTFALDVRGGAAALAQGLAGSTRLVPEGSAGGAPSYRYQPAR